jgi:hypothetical protein
VARWVAASASQRRASNLRISTQRPPCASVPSSGISVVFDDIGVDSSVTASGVKKPRRAAWRCRMPCRCTMPLGRPVVPEL